MPQFRDERRLFALVANGNKGAKAALHQLQRQLSPGHFRQFCRVACKTGLVGAKLHLACRFVCGGDSLKLYRQVVAKNATFHQRVDRLAANAGLPAANAG